MDDVIDSSYSKRNRQGSREWLRAQASLDWSVVGLPDLDDWDQALLTVVNLLAHSPSPMAVMIGPKGILVANESAQSLFAGTTGPVNGRSVLDVLPGSAAFYASVLESGLAGNALSFREQPIRLAAGGRDQTHWFNLDFIPVEGSDSTPLAVLGIASDISSFVRRVRGLTESEQRLRLALEGSGMVGIWTLDVASRLATADANVARTYGLPPALCETGVPGERFVEAVHPDDREQVRAALATAIRDGSPYRRKYRVVADSGQTRWVITSAKPVLDEAGQGSRLL